MVCVWERVDVVVAATVVTAAPSKEIAIESNENKSKRKGGRSERTSKRSIKR
jgi:hypothetical protein